MLKADDMMVDTVKHDDDVEIVACAPPKTAHASKYDIKLHRTSAVRAVEERPLFGRLMPRSAAVVERVPLVAVPPAIHPESPRTTLAQHDSRTSTSAKPTIAASPAKSPPSRAQAQRKEPARRQSAAFERIGAETSLKDVVLVVEARARAARESGAVKTEPSGTGWEADVEHAAELAASGKYLEALHKSESVLERFPHCGEAMLSRGQSLLYLGRLEECERQCEVLSLVAPTSPQPYLIRGYRRCRDSSP